MNNTLTTQRAAQIKTWKERRQPDGPYWQTSETAMQAEISDLRTALYVRDVEIDRISISAQQNADAAVEAEDKLEILRAAAQQGLEALDFLQGVGAVHPSGTKAIAALTIALTKKATNG